MLIFYWQHKCNSVCAEVLFGLRDELLIKKKVFDCLLHMQHLTILRSTSANYLITKKKIKHFKCSQRPLVHTHK